MARANPRACPASTSALGRGRAPETCRGSKMGGGHTSARVVGERRWRLGKRHKWSPRARRHEDVGGSWVPSAVPGLPPARRAWTSTGGAIPDPRPRRGDREVHAQAAAPRASSSCARWRRALEPGTAGRARPPRACPRVQWEESSGESRTAPEREGGGWRRCLVRGWTRGGRRRRVGALKSL